VKVLVTGGAGFIGAHLADEYSKRGSEVMVLDNLNDYYSIELKKLRVNHFLSHPGVEFKNTDLVNLQNVQEAIVEFAPDTVVHMAAQAGVRLPVDSYNKYTSSNLVGFANVLQTAIKLEVPNFLYASSSSVYGNSDQLPYSEDQENLQPISYYGATKLSNEILASAMTNGTSTRAIGLRFFTVYGPWGRPDMAYFRLVRDLILQEEFTLFGDGSLKRDFTFISDAVECVLALSDYLGLGKPIERKVFNIGGGNNRSMNDLISIVNNLATDQLQIRSGESFKGDVRETIADSSNLRKAIGMAPEKQLEFGIQAVFNWMKSPDIHSKLINWR
jgi:UDP-glucuronate 4-epimerase